ncbi:MAG TPA: DUF502 domain-containing protein [Burkholderiaceae bacterium]|nr:DUF502 domain-containing protein [Burkholderiaceae bacterium]
MLRKYLIAGLLIWLPLAITLWVLDFIVTTMDRTLTVLPVSWHPDQVLGFHVPGLGLVMSVIILLVTGALAANIIGARMFAWWEAVLVKIPIVRPIYSSVKQVSDTLFASKGQSFRKVVLIEFPNRGQWTFGFVVGAPGHAIERETGGELVTVYVPTAPNPTSGYVLIVRPSEVKELDVSVDDALKFHLSMGVVAPSVRPQRSALTTEGPGVPG